VYQFFGKYCASNRPRIKRWYYLSHQIWALCVVFLGFAQLWWSIKGGFADTLSGESAHPGQKIANNR
jgi:hypothetical protein